MRKILSREKRQSEPTKIQNLLKHNIFIIWDAKYDLGIPIVDEQHRGIAATINSLYFGIQNKNHYAKNTFAPIVNMINDYTRIHFKTEEAFLEKIDFSHAEKHRKLHGELLEKLMYTGSQSLLNKDPEQFMDFLKNWWLTHICKEDLLYRDFFLL